MNAAHHPTTHQQERTNARAAARRVPLATRPLYRHAQATLRAAAQRVSVLCLTQSDNPQALTYDLMRLEQALYQSLRLQRSMKQRRRQRKEQAHLDLQTWPGLSTCWEKHEQKQRRR